MWSPGFQGKLILPWPYLRRNKCQGILEATTIEIIPSIIFFPDVYTVTLFLI